jgi:hypothetical protein
MEILTQDDINQLVKLKTFFSIEIFIDCSFLDTEHLLRHTHSPRPITRINDYLNERPIFPSPYVSPSSNLIK